MNKIFTIIILFISITGYSQNDSISNLPMNTADNMLSSENILTIGGYVQIDYNQAINSETYQNGNLDVHRLVMLFGYKFNKRTSFITEIEFEHVKEVYVEQAFLNYKINDYINFKGGLLLIPMGIVNEYHEPPTFNGVERPNLDKVIVPSTWREIGAGFTGRFNDIGLKYQVYVLNGFSSFAEGDAKLSGSTGLRNGRQKGAESFMNSPCFSGKLDYYAVRGLKIGLSGYFGNTNSDLYNGLNKSDNTSIIQADSSIVGISMFGTDIRYSFKGFLLKGQYNYISLSNTQAYNEQTGSDVGSQLSGFYTELSYNVFRPFNLKTELIPFVRYENYDTHFATDQSIIKNDAYHKEEIIFGLGWKPTKGTIIKADFQKTRSALSNDRQDQLNFGIGVMF